MWQIQRTDLRPCVSSLEWHFVCTMGYWQLRQLKAHFLYLDTQWPVPDINQWTVQDKIDAVSPFLAGVSNFALFNTIGTKKKRKVRRRETHRLIERCKERRIFRRGRQRLCDNLLCLVLLRGWLMEPNGTPCEKAKWGQCRTSILLSVLWVPISLNVCSLSTYCISSHLHTLILVISVALCFVVFYILSEAWMQRGFIFSVLLIRILFLRETTETLRWKSAIKNLEMSEYRGVISKIYLKFKKCSLQKNGLPLRPIVF